MKSAERIAIALHAGHVAAAALEFQKPTSLADMQIKKIFLNDLIKSVNELKKLVLETTDISEGETGDSLMKSMFGGG